MSLIYVFAALIAEFALWFYASHVVENPIERLRNLQTSALVSIACSSLYITSWIVRDSARFIDVDPVIWFAAFNGFLLLITTSALVVRRVSR